MRGIDNAAYYRLGTDARYYMDFTGCGNSLNVSRPCVLKLIMDSLRYWVSEMHVDGFRFDLCSALARQLFEVDQLGAFFDIIHQDPLISQVKLIAEPWDLGPGVRRRHFFQGRPIHGVDVKDLYWVTPAGTEMSDQDWNARNVSCLGVGLVEDQIDETDDQGERIVSNSFLILLNADHECVPFRLGARVQDQTWELVFDTSSASIIRRILGSLTEYPLQPRSVAVLRPLNTTDVSCTNVHNEQNFRERGEVGNYPSDRCSES
jgi:pullulanase/glycogen debranching enzyme